MRALIVALTILATPLSAETIRATSKIASVTVYPEGAAVTRTVTFATPQGSNDLLITDLPLATPPEFLRMTAQGLQLGAYTLRTDRLPPTQEPESPEQTAAKAEIDRLEIAGQQALAGVAVVQARIDAANAQIAFLAGLGPDSNLAGADALLATSRMIGAETLAARQAAIAAGADMLPAHKALEKVQKAMTKAREALAALVTQATDTAALSVSFTAETAGEITLTLTHLAPDAHWSPVYDATLTRAENRLTLTRGVLVSQSSGEDWADVALTVSTARPSSQSAPGTLWPDLRRIGEDVPQSFASGAMADMAAPAPVAKESVAATAEFDGETVTYKYPEPVTIASGVEDLRLALDKIDLDPTIRAEAVPQLDATAYLVAEFTNTTPEILLPGTVFLTRDNTLVGAADLESIAAGDKSVLAFGAIEGLRLTRIVPERAEGDRGVFAKTNQIVEKATLKVSNLTAEDWPVRLIDRVSYSEQEDLVISYDADPSPDMTDLDDRRGILAWDFTLPAKGTKSVVLETTLRWPQGQNLR